jgi:ATP-dependent Zn protease
LSRMPRYSLFIFFLVAVLGIVFWFTWQQVESGSTGDQWSYSTLLNNAQAGKVAKVEIKGSDARVTEREANAQHHVHLPDNTNHETLASELTRDNVDVSFQSGAVGSGVYWVSALLPNLILLLLIGGFMYYVLRATISRQNRRDRGKARHRDSDDDEKHSRGS